MASPQAENGYLKIANELFEAIVAHPFTKRQIKVVLAVVRKTYGYGKKVDDLTSSQLASMTGLADSHCRAAVLELERLRVLNVSRGKYGKCLGMNKDYEQWGVPDRCVPVRYEGRTETVQVGVPKQYDAGYRDGTDKRQPQNTTPIDLSIPPPRSLVSESEDTAGSGGGPEKLCFPSAMPDAERREASAMLDEVGEDAQAVLDVLQAAIEAGQVRKTRIAMLAALVRRWRQGAFDPTPGRKVAERRERRASKTPHAPRAAPSTTAVLREHARLRGIPEDEYLDALSR